MNEEYKNGTLSGNPGDYTTTWDVPGERQLHAAAELLALPSRSATVSSTVAASEREDSGSSV